MLGGGDTREQRERGQRANERAHASREKEGAHRMTYPASVGRLPSTRSTFTVASTSPMGM